MSDDLDRNELELGAAFDAASYDDWRKAAESALRGADFDRVLQTRTYEGFPLQPLYSRERDGSGSDPAGLPGIAPFTRGATAGERWQRGWTICQRYAHADPAEAAAAIARDLEGGVQAIEIALDACLRYGQPPEGDLFGSDGNAVNNAAGLAQLLENVDLGEVAVSLDAGVGSSAAAEALMTLWRDRSVENSKAAGNFGVDPLGTLAAGGSLPGGLDAALTEMAGLAGKVAGDYPNVRAIRINSAVYYDAGASESQDIAAALATGIAYVRAMEQAGMALETAFGQIGFALPLGPDQFMSIAKLRVLRRLWARVAEACGIEAGSGAHIRAGMARRAVSSRDPQVNMLRGTLMGFAAAVGGADEIQIAPFDTAGGMPGELGFRVARNTQIMLMRESSLGMVIDPAGGSWYMEQLTRQLSQSAWAAFQEIERAGGMAQALSEGFVAGMIDETWSARRTNIARRRDALIGVSEFADLDESGTESTPPDLNKLRAAVAAASDPFVSPESAASSAALAIEPLPARALGMEFEDLRAESDAYHAREGKRPAVFLANIGSLAQFTARATFARNFFAAGGIEAAGDDGFDDAAAAARAFAASGARIACLCSSDPNYAEHATAFAAALKGAGCKHLYLAGNPGDQRETYETAGIDDFVYMGSNAIDALTDAFKAATA